MTPAEKMRREVGMQVLLAEEELAAGAPDARVYDLVLAVTGSEERASEAYSARLMARMKRGETPEV